MYNIADLSREIAYALRHAPWEYELEMDEDGWVPIQQLLDALHRDKRWATVSEKDLHNMIDQSEKKRYEIKSKKIRAFYGHSIPMKIDKEAKRPPDTLYHGTARRFLKSIKEKGVVPQSRQYVHLSQDIETAESVGLRHDDKPCILKINSKKAWEEGIRFYYGNEKVWLADEIPYKYIEEWNGYPVPRHLEGILQVDSKKSNDFNLEGKLHCRCGCEKFRIRTFSEQDKNGCLHVSKYQNGYSLMIKAECCNCNDRYLIFDMAEHGYNGFICRDGITVSDNELKGYGCNKCNGQSFEIEIEIEVEDREQFIEEVVEEEPDKYVPEDYVDAFDWICITIKCSECGQVINDWVNFETS